MATTQDSYTIDVRSYELDSYAHVNNGAYIAWFEDARERFLRAEGRDYSYFPRQMQISMLVVNVNCEFLSPAVSGDSLKITTRLVKTGRTSIAFRQTAHRISDGAICARARVVMVFVGGDGVSCEIPQEFRESYGVAEGSDSWSEEDGGERA